MSRREGALIRPPREEFVRLCADHTQAEIAAMFGVTKGAVQGWQKFHECRAKPAKLGRPFFRPPDTPRVAVVPQALDFSRPARLSYWVQGGLG